LDWFRLEPNYDEKCARKGSRWGRFQKETSDDSFRSNAVWRAKIRQSFSNDANQTGNHSDQKKPPF
jgi:hypothetical protein